MGEILGCEGPIQLISNPINHRLLAVETCKYRKMVTTQIALFYVSLTCLFSRLNQLGFSLSKSLKCSQMNERNKCGVAVVGEKFDDLLFALSRNQKRRYFVFPENYLKRTEMCRWKPRRL